VEITEGLMESHGAFFSCFHRYNPRFTHRAVIGALRASRTEKENVTTIVILCFVLLHDRQHNTSGLTLSPPKIRIPSLRMLRAGTICGSAWWFTKRKSFCSSYTDKKNGTNIIAMKNEC